MGHNVLTKLVQAMYTQLGVQTKKEPTGLVDGNQRPADVMILPKEVCHDATLPVALDIGITDAGKNGPASACGRRNNCCRCLQFAGLL